MDELVNERLLNAIDSCDGHVVNNIAEQLDAAEIADFLASCGFDVHKEFLSLLGNKINPKILTFLDSDVLENVICILGIEETASILALLNDHDFLSVMQETPSDIRFSMTSHLITEQQDLVKIFLSYPEGSAGRLATDKIITVPSYWDVNRAVNFIRSHKGLQRNFYQLFVVDGAKKIVGQIFLSELLQLPENALIINQMDRDVLTVGAEIDQEEVVYMFRKYALTNLPVVAENGTIVGVISVEDIADVVREEISDDIMKMSGVVGSSNINARIINSVISRMPWLIVNTILSLGISYMVSSFNDTITSVIALVALLPIITSIGGCASSQSVSSSIRAIALREITKSNLVRIVYKELAISIYLGLSLGFLSMIPIAAIYQDINLCVLYISAVISIFLVSSIVGLLIPVLMNHMRLDPAIVSPVIVTAVSDTFAYGFVLGIAHIIFM